MNANYHRRRGQARQRFESPATLGGVSFTPACAFVSLLTMAATGKVAQRLCGETIASRDNRWLKRFRAALRGSASAEENCIGVEGSRVVAEALRAGLLVDAVLVSTSGERHLVGLRAYLGPAVRVLRTSDRLFSSVADTQTPQGIAALVRPRATSFDDVVRGVPLVVVLISVQDPGNVGTILRAAEAFAATGAIACGSPGLGTANPFSPKALRASAGAVLRFPVLSGMATPVVLAQLRVIGVKTYAASPERADLAVKAASAGQPALSPWEADLHSPAALLVGNEGAGLPPEVARSADALIRIPLAGGVDSLNAAVAASVLLYEAARQRRLT